MNYDCYNPNYSTGRIYFTQGIPHGASIPYLSKVILCLSAYLFFGDSNQGIPSHKYSKERQRIELIWNFIQPKIQHLSKSEQWFLFYEIYAVCTYRPSGHSASKLPEPKSGVFQIPLMVPAKTAKKTRRRTNTTYQRRIYRYKCVARSIHQKFGHTDLGRLKQDHKMRQASMFAKCSLPFVEDALKWCSKNEFDAK